MKFINFNTVKKIISIFIFSVYLLSTTQVSELLKLPKVFEHYKMHSQWDTSTTFFSFLMEHYAEDNSKNADYDEDMKLPFKNLNNCNNSIVSFCPITPVFKLLKRATYTQQVKRSPTVTFLYSSTYLSTIWQPPKAC